jgi:hypothetical protein
MTAARTKQTKSVATGQQFGISAVIRHHRIRYPHRRHGRRPSPPEHGCATPIPRTPKSSMAAAPSPMEHRRCSLLPPPQLQQGHGRLPSPWERRCRTVRTTNASHSSSADLRIHLMGVQSISFSPLGFDFMEVRMRMGIFSLRCRVGWG